VDITQILTNVRIARDERRRKIRRKEQDVCKVPTQRGQVHVFGQQLKAIAGPVGRKMDLTPDFAVALP
jgi:hypothetical protein